AGLKAAKAKAAANAPSATQIIQGNPAPPKTPGGSLQGIDGLKDSGTVCSYFGTGCQPPDHGIAASDKYVVQMVNTSFAVYATKTGKRKKFLSLQSFFKVPAPTPAGCDPFSNDQPFLS